MTQQKSKNIFVCDDNGQSETAVSCSDCLRSVFLSEKKLSAGHGGRRADDNYLSKNFLPKQFHSLEAESESRQNEKWRR
jgi:hypothetical protein